MHSGKATTENLLCVSDLSSVPELKSLKVRTSIPLPVLDMADYTAFHYIPKHATVHWLNRVSKI